MSTTQRVVRKQLAGAEDLLQGVGAVTQTRGGGTYAIHKLDVPIPMTTLAEMQASSAEFVRLYWSDTRYTDFRRNPEGTDGIVSTIGGTWEEVGDSLKLRELLVKQFAEAGITLANGSFEQGVTGVTKGTGVYQESTGKVYQWQLTSTFNITAGTLPSDYGTVGVDWIDKSSVTLKALLNGNTGAAISLSQVATAYNIPFSNLAVWTQSEVVSLGSYRWYNNQVWAANTDSVTCGASPDYTNFHQLYPWLAPNEVALSAFGAVVNTDITAAMTRAINYAKSNGWLTIVDDIIGTKYITGSLPQMNSSFNFVPLRSINRKLCIIKFDGNGGAIGSAPNGAMSYVGGSGAAAGKIIWDITLDGGYTVSPLLFQGFCGPIIENTTYRADVAAVLSNDIGTGTFTEFVQFHKCDVHCNAMFTMYRGAGNDSFHGNGWVDTTVNINGVRPYVVGLGVKPDGTMDTSGRSAWYNGVMSGSLFNYAYSGLEIVKVFTSFGQEVVSVDGGLKLELTQNTKFSSSIRVMTANTIIEIGGKFIYGNARPVDRLQIPSNALLANTSKPIHKTYVKGAGTTTFNLDSDSGMGQLISLTATAGNYEYQVLYWVVGQISGVIACTATLLATGRAFNTAGYGAPVLQWSGNQLQVYNANWSSVPVTLEVLYHPTATYAGTPIEF